MLIFSNGAALQCASWNGDHLLRENIVRQPDSKTTPSPPNKELCK